MAKYVWKTCFVALITMIVIAEVGERLTGIHIPWVMRLSIVLGMTVGMAFLKSTLNLVTAMEGEKPLAGTVRNTLGPDRSPATPKPNAPAESDERD
jgi:hypothetical protein